MSSTETVKRKLCTQKTIFAIIFVILMTFVIQWQYLEIRPRKWYNLPSQCLQPLEIVNDTVELALKIHTVLQSKDISHILCYGSLFGALRRQDMLPWDKDVDFCVWDEDLNKKLGESHLYSIFKSEGISLTYDPSAGVYSANYKKGKADIVLFQMAKDFIWMKRVGTRYKNADHNSQVHFPSRLLAPPLQSLKFHGHNMPVPNGGIELQRYLYPDDWWLEVKPPNC